jgi:hypothetical protein
LSLLATITLEGVTFRTYALFLAFLTFFKCILEVIFCEGVQHYQQFCLDHLNCVKMVAFQLYLQLGKKGNVWWVGDGSHVVLGKNFPDEKKV